jgi:hypothetical protein
LTLVRTANGGHRIELRAGAGPGEVIACLESIESERAPETAAANWPASPPVQEWHDEPRAGATVLMAVGRAGRSHWSLSCEVTADGRAMFDVAARISELPERLGSSYRLLIGAAQQTAPAELTFTSNWRLTVDAATTRLQYDANTRTIKIEPATPPTNHWPQTLRWGYRLGE